MEKPRAVVQHLRSHGPFQGGPGEAGIPGHIGKACPLRPDGIAVVNIVAQKIRNGVDNGQLLRRNGGDERLKSRAFAFREAPQNHRVQQKMVGEHPILIADGEGGGSGGGQVSFRVGLWVT